MGGESSPFYSESGVPGNSGAELEGMLTRMAEKTLDSRMTPQVAVYLLSVLKLQVHGIPSWPRLPPWLQN